MRYVFFSHLNITILYCFDIINNKKKVNMSFLISEMSRLRDNVEVFYFNYEEKIATIFIS